jgi:flagellar protein FliS
MHSPAPSTSRYLDARVASASQPELQLMLLDGALRFGQQARRLWPDDSQRLECDRLMRRVLDVVEELVRSVASGRVAESKRLEEEYAFIFRQLTAAHLTHAAAELDSALKLLEFQRETWRMACEKVKQPRIPAPLADADALPTSGFSLQA